MAKKYYAVKNGRQIGIYETWEECKQQVIEFSGAEYKAFSTREEANNYINGEDPTQGLDIPDDILCAFVDGSFDVATNRYGSGMVLLYQGEEKTFYKAGEHPTLVSMRNVAGEITASVMAMRYAITNHFPKLIIYHDYEGISKWCLGEWKTEREGTKMYKEFYDSIKDKLTVTFIKVEAHTGNHYNELADELAKKSLGIEK
ncbi:MAG: reverse transcriptase-like protein [Ruminococcaceae bacterium]|nr:reverse transcriptase-like protein [Oscillospiraceae bacterium]